LDVYGGLPEWERNLEAGRMAGSEIEKAVSKHNPGIATVDALDADA
jgi:hypothetical protein